MVSTPKGTLLLLVILPLALPTWASADRLYCCQDSKSGRRICADSAPPAACRGQAYRIYDRGGNPIADVAAPLTAEQRNAAAEAEKRKQVEEAARQEQQRLDQALLATYTSLDDIDSVQRKSEKELQEAIRNAHNRIVELQKRFQSLATEAEFYQRKTLPANLESELRTLKYEIKLQQELIDSKRKELNEVQARFDTDRRRYTELTGRSKPSSR
jgi:predicted RNase H-like nuclease (RuvC/YqgF family)